MIEGQEENHPQAESIVDLSNKIIDSFSLDTFLSLNASPSLRTYPSIDTFKSSFVSFHDKLYKRKNENDCGLLKNYLAVLDNKPLDKRLKRKIGRSAMRYVHSHCIIKLFNGYFSLVEYHHQTCRTFPQVFDAYLAAILLIFGSLNKKKIETLLREACGSTRMHEFYLDLYKSWEAEIDTVEKDILINYNVK
ncbi:hypothetical protein GINT2_000961 [Glugoides intestinalis]